MNHMLNKRLSCAPRNSPKTMLVGCGFASNIDAHDDSIFAPPGRSHAPPRIGSNAFRRFRRRSPRPDRAHPILTPDNPLQEGEYLWEPQRAD